MDESGEELYDDDEAEPAVDSTLHFLSHGVMAAGAAVSGLVSFVAVLGLSIPALKRMFEEMGIVLPAMTGLVISWRLHVVSPLLSLFAVVLIAWLSILKKPKLSVPASLAALFVCFIPTGICVLHAMGNRYGLMEGIMRFDTGRGDVEPGRTSEVADEVIKGVRIGLELGVGTFQTPDGEQRRYFITQGPGLPAAPDTLPPYEEARKLPGCVVLPWPDRPGENLDRDREVIVQFPTGAAGGMAPKAMVGKGEAPLVPGNYTYVTPEDIPANVTPATVAAGGDGNCSWTILIRRARVDANADGVVSRGPSVMQPRAEPGDPFSDGLLEIRVQVFRAFDPAANPKGDPVTNPGSPDVYTVPYSNIPDTTFLVVLSVP